MYIYIYYMSISESKIIFCELYITLNNREIKTRYNILERKKNLKNLQRWTELLMFYNFFDVYVYALYIYQSYIKIRVYLQLAYITIRWGNIYT